MDQQQLYLELFKEYRSEIKHQESQRSTVSTICVGLAAGLIGLSFQDKLYLAKPYLGLLLINFSLVAILMLRKLYERFALGRERAKAYLRAVDRCARKNYASEAEWETAKLEKLWEDGRACNESNFPFLSFVRLHHLWEALLVGSLVVGLMFVVGSGWKDENFKQNLHIQFLWQLWGWALLGPTVQSIFLFFFQRWGRTVELASRTPTIRPGRFFRLVWRMWYFARKKRRKVYD